MRSAGFQGSEHVRSWDIMDVCVFFRGSDGNVDVLFVDGVDGYNSADFLFRVADHDLRDIRLFVEMMFQHVEHFVGVVLNEKRNVVVIDVDVVFVQGRHFGREMVLVLIALAREFIVASFVVHAGFRHIIFEQVLEGGFDHFGFQCDVVLRVAAGTTPGQTSRGHNFAVGVFLVNFREHAFTFQASNEGVAVFGRVRWRAFQFHLQFAVALGAVVQMDQVEDNVARASFNFDFQSGGQWSH